MENDVMASQPGQAEEMANASSPSGKDSRQSKLIAFDATQLERVERWASDHRMTFTGAVRRLVSLGLAADAQGVLAPAVHDGVARAVDGAAARVERRVEDAAEEIAASLEEVLASLVAVHGTLGGIDGALKAMSGPPAGIDPEDLWLYGYTEDGREA